MSTITAGLLVRRLESTGLRLLGGDDSRVIRSALCTVHDPAVDAAPDASGVLFVVNVEFAAVAAVVADAATAGYDAVIVRNLGDDQQACAQSVEIAARHGIALVELRGATAWTHLEHLIDGMLRDLDDVTIETARGLFELATGIAQLTGGATSIEDRFGRVVGYSSVEGQVIDHARRDAILGRRAAPAEQAVSHYSRLLEVGGVIEARGLDHGVLDRLGCVIRMNDEFLGSVWVIDGGNLRDDVKEVLERSAELIAVHMVRLRRHDEADQNRGSDLTRRATGGGPEARRAISRMSLPAAGPFSVAVIAHAAMAKRVQQDRLSRFFASLGSYLQAWQPQSGWFTDGTTMTILFCGDQAADDVWLANSLDLVVERAGAMEVPLWAGTGRVVTTPEEILESCRDATDLVELARHEPPATILTRHRHHSRLHLLRMQRLLDDAPWILSEPVMELRRLDAEKSTDLCDTWLAWFDHNGDVARAAAALTVHPNTLRHRLRRAQELAGIDTEGDDALTAWLTLRLTAEARRT